jgi:alpha,alpha-trehalase
VTTPVPIGDYGFLSDGEVIALVSPGGAVEWMCLPRFDSPSVFGSILGPHAGSFRVGPADVEVPTARRYVPGRMILETSWGTPTGWLVVSDTLLIGPWRHTGHRSDTHHRTPVDYDAEHILLRQIRCVAGEVPVSMECAPAFDYGRSPPAWSYVGEGYGEAAAAGDGLDLHLTTDLRLGVEGGGAGSPRDDTARCRAGRRCDGHGDGRGGDDTADSGDRRGQQATRRSHVLPPRQDNSPGWRSIPGRGWSHGVTARWLRRVCR